MAEPPLTPQWPRPTGPDRSADGGAVLPDVEEVRAWIHLDPGCAEGRAEATVDFHMTACGRPAIDLRQNVDAISLDGHPLDPGVWAPRDLGGGAGAGIRVLDVDLPADSRHRLHVAYRLATPDAEGALPVDWRDGTGARWDLWMSDLHPGRYLESWIPAPLCHDRFALTVDLEVGPGGRPHTVVTNGLVQHHGAAQWTVRFDPSFTALSPMLVVAPTDEVEERRGAMTLPGRATPITLATYRHVEVDADLAACEADTAAWMAQLSTRYGPWVHGDAMTVFVWGPGRGMEYDGATTASVGAMEHEVFHSWFGRGIKPATASDGWIDEAFTSWATSTRRSEEPRYAVEALDLDQPPTVLHPASPWSRHTPIASYTAGARLFSGMAHLLGGAPQLRSAMSAWYRTHAGGLVTTSSLQAHLQAWAGSDIGPLWRRYVHGIGE